MSVTLILFLFKITNISMLNNKISSLISKGIKSGILIGIAEHKIFAKEIIMNKASQLLCIATIEQRA